jgi:hypothetical protein
MTPQRKGSAVSAKFEDAWVLELFRIVDAMDAPAFGRLFIEDGSMRFGNSTAVRGRQQVEQALSSFYSTIGGLSHEITGLWKGRWEHGDVRSIESLVTYTRRDGSVTAPIPVTTTIRMNGSRIADYRIFMDISPLFSPGRP